MLVLRFDYTVIECMRCSVLDVIIVITVISSQIIIFGLRRKTFTNCRCAETTAAATGRDSPRKLSSDLARDRPQYSYGINHNTHMFNGTYTIIVAQKQYEPYYVWKSVTFARISYVIHVPPTPLRAHTAPG